jgi:hypothetical protein
MLEQAITPCKSNPDQLDMCTGKKRKFDTWSFYNRTEGVI